MTDDRRGNGDKRLESRTARAPWTEDEIANLNRWQRCGWVHAFTCGAGDRGDDTHWNYAEEHGGDAGQLVAAEDGWKCPACGWRQDWCHDFMLLGPPPNPWDVFKREAS